MFEPQAFYPLMQALCGALSDQLDNPPRASDIHAQVVLHEAADALGGWLAPRAVGMAAFAAQDIVQALSQATHFLRGPAVADGIRRARPLGPARDRGKHARAGDCRHPPARGAGPAGNDGAGVAGRRGTGRLCL
ncbi:hypothetical protein [Cupriavidus necator]|uniref:hypothetical protein n=1 Tax=Cupriavidus necator TaxID=106590 RepID=UPI0005B372CE|nr:hypothetical protein [Cupriavidus necator]